MHDKIKSIVHKELTARESILISLLDREDHNQQRAESFLVNVLQLPHTKVAPKPFHVIKTTLSHYEIDKEKLIAEGSTENNRRVVGVCGFLLHYTYGYDYSHASEILKHMFRVGSKSSYYRSTKRIEEMAGYDDQFLEEILAIRQKVIHELNK